MDSTNSLPKHVAIIPDGNRRWAREHGLPDLKGHMAGAERTVGLVKAAHKLGIKVITFWGFSTENWKRSDEEVSYLMRDIFIAQSKKYLEEFYKQEARFIHLGRKDRLPKELVEILADLEQKTSKFQDRTVCFAIDYGGRNEVVRAAQKAMNSGVKPEDITEELLGSYLDTKDLPDPDMIIRTSGEMRLSGLMPWQSVYSELFFIKEYFPDLTDELFTELVMSFGKRNRTFGGVR